MLHHHFSSSAMARPSLIKYWSILQWAAGRGSDENCAYQIQFLVFYYGSHIVRKFDIRLHRLSFWMTVCECQHITSRSFNHFIEYGRWGAHIDSLSIHAIPTISSSNLFYVAPCARGTCDVTTVSFSAYILKSPVYSWSLRWLCTKPYIFNDAGRHPPSSIILSSTLRTLLNITWQWKFLQRMDIVCYYDLHLQLILRPKDFLNFFLSFTTTLTSLTLHGGACDMVFQNMLLVGSYSAGVYETAYLDYFTAVTM